MSLNKIEIKNEICREYEENIRLYKDLSDEMEYVIRSLVRKHNIDVKSIMSRPKDVDSLRRKIKRKNYKYSCLNEITDLAGVRVITYYSDDVYRVEEIIKRNFKVDIANSIDKAKSLEYDRFGYLSLHYVVELKDEDLKHERYKSFKGIRFEIQIRSILQDAWAEIEHDLGYKNKKSVPDKIKRDFSRLAGILELADKEFENIRDSIDNYEDQMAVEVRDLKEIIMVDDVSVRAYINYNRYYRSILDFLGEEIAIRHNNSDVDMSKCLISANIVSLNEVEELIRKNKIFIFNMIKYERVGVYNYLGEADILLYVCYAKLINEENCAEKFIKFWEDNGYNTDNISHEHKLGWIEQMKRYMN